MRARGMISDEALIAKLSPLGWDHINLTGDYVWSDALALDHDGFMPLGPCPRERVGERYRNSVSQ